MADLDRPLMAKRAGPPLGATRPGPAASPAEDDPRGATEHLRVPASATRTATAGIGRAIAAVRRQAWPEAYAILRQAPLDSMTGEQLDAFADAAWWSCQLEESLALRRRAYSAHAALADARAAARAAFHLADNYLYLGQRAVAVGWLRRGRGHVAPGDVVAEGGLLDILEADMAQQEGRLETVLALATRAADIGRRLGDGELVALATQQRGRLLIDLGQTEEGLALLDEAMTAVVAGETTAFFTGWIYCQVIGACLRLADLRRASDWSEAARAWCEAVPADAPFPALCRINRAELATLRGALAEAEAEARLAADDLVGYHPILAAAAFYALGEAQRRAGHLHAAEQSFGRAHAMGWNPHPGLALVHLAHGRAETARIGLELALASDPTNRLSRARLLAARVEIALAEADSQAARVASDELESIAASVASPPLHALAAYARGAVALAEGDPIGALTNLRTAWQTWSDERMPYEAAQARRLIGLASARAGDEEGGRREMEAARQAFAALGARADTLSLARHIGQRPTRPGGLTDRQVEVLRLVAAGRSNREIAAELVVSEHTVARHLQNIFARLGVSSRAAATAFAVEHHLI